MTLLEVDGIDTYYGQSLAIEDVTLEIEQGEVVSILGRNGAGKTTTLRSIVGVMTPRNGQIRYNGDDITDEQKFKTIQRGLGYVPEDRQVWTNLTVEENLEVPAGRGGEWAITDVYELFPTLRELKGARAGTMSGGEQQMLAIGRGLLGGTELLLLDEPTEGLAPMIVEDVHDAILELANDLTIVLVEQNIDVALSVADRAYLLANGQVVHEAPADELDSDDDVLKEHVSI
jgi:branched-chain amino acid transport system ATP-binding protein